MLTYNGTRVILSERFTESQVTYVPRTWRERLTPRIVSAFPRLFVYWRPWVALRPVVTKIPARYAYRMHGAFLMHPHLFRQLQQTLKEK